MIWSVQNTALALACLSFAAFLLGTAATIFNQFKTRSLADQAAQLAAKASGQGGQNLAPASPGMPSVQELTDLVKALSAAIDSIVKAGPALAGLLASVLFLGIAAWASINSSGPKTTCTLPAQTSMEFENNRLRSPVSVKCEPDPAPSPASKK